VKYNPNEKLTGGKKIRGCLKKSGPGLPLVSVITVVHNDKDRLEESIREVKNQTYSNKEYIVIDGGSKDGTLEILRRNDSDIDYWVSEIDNGIYDAMDKGVDAADGEWFYFLGVDDVFYSHDTLESIFEGRVMPRNLAMVLGDVYIGERLFKSRFNRSLYFKNTVHHQGVFYRRHVFDQFRFCQARSSDRYRRHYRISGDYRLNLMLFVQGATCMHVNRTIARCQRGVSMEGQLFGYIEEILIRHEHIGFLRAIFFDVFTFLRYVYKKILKSRSSTMAWKL